MKAEALITYDGDMIILCDAATAVLVRTALHHEAKNVTENTYNRDVLEALRDEIGVQLGDTLQEVADWNRVVR